MLCFACGLVAASAKALAGGGTEVGVPDALVVMTGGAEAVNAFGGGAGEALRLATGVLTKLAVGVLLVERLVGVGIPILAKAAAASSVGLVALVCILLAELLAGGLVKDGDVWMGGNPAPVFAAVGVASGGSAVGDAAGRLSSPANGSGGS